MKLSICTVVIEKIYIFCCVANVLWIQSTHLAYALLVLSFPIGALLVRLWAKGEAAMRPRKST